MAKFKAATDREFYGKEYLTQTGKNEWAYFSKSRPGITVTVSSIGVPKYMASLKNWTPKMERAAERGVQKAVKYLLKETLVVTPELTGILKKSGATFVKKAGKETIGVVYFNDHICPYAIYVHEDLTKYHKPPTMAKFLQKTQWRLRGELSLIIRQEIEKVRP